MIHEKAARGAHPEARQFRPVRHILRVTLGWTFEIPGKDEASVKYGWVTVDGEVSEDKLDDVRDAERNLRAYLPSRREMDKQEAKAARKARAS